MLQSDSASETPFDLSRFSLADMTRCGAVLRRMGSGAGSMEEVAQRTVRYLHAQLRDGGGEAPACGLVRLFVTMPFAQLQPDQQEFARTVFGRGAVLPETKCLTLLATAGTEAPWNSRFRSAGHKALPLPSPEAVQRSPMIAQLIHQLGIELGALLSSDQRLVLDQEQHGFNVFHVADAVGSPVIPAQREFVVPHGIRSVIGFGGLLPPGELFATILFSRTPIPREVADFFRTVALNVRYALLPFATRQVFS